jgi:hypothetical protein
MSMLEAWLSIIRNCSVDNTYKMAWGKAITELSLEKDYSTLEDTVEIFLIEIAQKFIKYYWDQTIFFYLNQSSNPNKPPEILSNTKLLIESYKMKTANNQPIKFIRSNVEVLCSDAPMKSVLS